MGSQHIPWLDGISVSDCCNKSTQFETELKRKTGIGERPWPRIKSTYQQTCEYVHRAMQHWRSNRCFCFIIYYLYSMYQFSGVVGSRNSNVWNVGRALKVGHQNNASHANCKFRQMQMCICAWESHSELHLFAVSPGHYIRQQTDGPHNLETRPPSRSYWKLILSKYFIDLL